MIKMKELLNRVYDGNKCVRFEYPLVLHNVQPKVRWTAMFERMEGTPCGWSMRVCVPRTRDKDTEVYCFEYILPRDNLPLELIAATGLRYFQLYLQEEIQAKSEFVMVLGSAVEGM